MVRPVPGIDHLESCSGPPCGFNGLGVRGLFNRQWHAIQYLLEAHRRLGGNIFAGVIGKLVRVQAIQDTPEARAMTGRMPIQKTINVGEFVEIVPNSRIIMTFTWIENGGDIGETVLSIELFAQGNGTELVLTHERLPDDEVRAAHQGGWQSTLECLEEYLG